MFSQCTAGFGLGLSLILGGTAPAGDLVQFSIRLDGTQENPPVVTSALGSGTATLDLDTNEFSWDINYQNLSSAETAAHFHGPAGLCENASPVITLSPGSPKVGSQVVTQTQADEILAGRWYINVHTADHLPGEIRGYIVPTPLDDPLAALIAPGAVSIQLETVATGMTAPNWGTFAPGDPNRLFVTDQDGTLWAVDLTTGEKSVFLDVSPLLVDLGLFGPGSFDERGLLGVAFHPEYQKNGLLYTYTSEHVFKPADFSTLPPGSPPNHRSVIREWQVPSPGDPNSVVDPATSRTLLRVDQPQFNHNAGAINFGPDGLLYIAFGDGGGADDHDGQPTFGAPMVGHGCLGNGQDITNPLGSVLRIDPLGSNSANGQYGIPADNPFVGLGPAGVVEEIYAYGFRNPFRFSFDRGTGDLWLADVGQNDIEEVNVVTSGGNYGWNHKEGTFFFERNGSAGGSVTDRPLDGPSPLIDPIAEYDHDDGIAIVGGFVYRGSRIAPLAGRYVFGEFAVNFNNDGRLFYLDESNTIREFNLTTEGDGLGLSVLGMGEDANGEVYVMANGTGTPSGETGIVLRIVTRVGDLNADGVVNVLDLLAMLGAWGPCEGCPADLNGDGVVNVLDLLIMLGNWG